MSLMKQIELDMREAMKTKDRKTNLLKYFVAEFSRRPNLNVELTDTEVISILKKYIKSIEETARAMHKVDSNGNVILSEEQTFEINILSKYIPKQVTDEEIIAWIKNNLEVPENPNARMKLMRDIMKHFGPSVDGNTVKSILTNL